MGLRRNARLIARQLARYGFPYPEGPGDQILRRTLITSSSGSGGGDTWGDQDYQVFSQWGRRSVIGAASIQVAGIQLLTQAAANVNAPGGASRSSTSDGHFVVMTTGTGAAPVDAGVPAFVDACRRAQLPVWETRLRLGQVDGTGWNGWWGMSDVTAGVNSPQAGVNPNTLHCAGFRFFRTQTDTTFFAVSGDNVSGQSTNTGVTVAAATTYDLMVDMSTAGEINYYINTSGAGRVLVHTETTVLPGNNNNMGLVNTIRRTAGTTDRSWSWMAENLRNTISLP